jgi:TRAP-type C4-dicarboxylate transport system permease small subunit
MSDVAGRGGRKLAEHAFLTAPEWILGTLMLGGVALTFANVIGRYVFGAAIYWAEEILVFTVIWGVFVGLVSAAYRNDFLSMDLFTAGLTGRTRLAHDVVVSVILVLCCAYVAVQSWHVVSLFAASDQRTVSARIPKAVPHAALLLGFSLVPVAVALRWFARLSQRRS